MTEKEIMTWMEEYLEGDNARKSALMMIQADIEEHGFETFLELPPETIISEYISVSEEVTQESVDDFRAMFNQELELAELGLEQSFKLNPPATMAAMRNGMTDIMKSLLLYVETQRMANALMETNEQDD